MQDFHPGKSMGGLMDGGVRKGRERSHSVGEVRSQDRLILHGVVHAFRGVKGKRPRGVMRFLVFEVLQCRDDVWIAGVGGVAHQPEETCQVRFFG